MLKTFKHLGLTRGSRYYSQQTTRKNVVHSTQQQRPSPNLVQYPYYVPRNSRGSLPVYTDIRNNGTRVLLLIQNVEGSVEVRFDTSFADVLYADSVYL